MPRPKHQVHATTELTRNPPAELPESHVIARVAKNEGREVFRVTLPAGGTVLVELPTRFRSVFLIHRGSYVLVDRAALADRENKLGGEIVNVVRDEKAWRKMAYWPKEFERKSLLDDASGDEESNVGKLPSETSEDEDTAHP